MRFRAELSKHSRWQSVALRFFYWLLSTAFLVYNDANDERWLPWVGRAAAYQSGEKKKSWLISNRSVPKR